MVEHNFLTEEQYYAPAVCKACGERLGWVGVSPSMKDWVFELHDLHKGCPAEEVGDGQDA